MYENKPEIISSELREKLLSSCELDMLEEAARAQCEHLTLEVSSITTYFQERFGDPRLPWCQHWLIQTVEGKQFCYPICEGEYELYENGHLPDWKTIDCYMFHGKFYQVFIDGVIRNTNFENSPNRFFADYKSTLKQIKELSVRAISIAEVLRDTTG